MGYQNMTHLRQEESLIKYKIIFDILCFCYWDKVHSIAQVA